MRLFTFPSVLFPIVIFFFSSTLKAQEWQELYDKTFAYYDAGDNENTLLAGNEALDAATNEMEQLFTLKLLSVICNEVGSFQMGIEYGLKEIELCHSQNLADSVISNSLNTLVSNYMGLQDYASAIQYLILLKSISNQVYGDAGLHYNRSISDLGYAYFMSDQYDSALFYFDIANQHLPELEEGGEDYLLNLFNIGQIYYQQEEFERSFKSFTDLSEIMEYNGLDTEPLYAETMESLGLAQYALDQFADSENSLEISSKIYTALGYSIVELTDLNNNLALVYLKNGKSAKSDSVMVLIGGGKYGSEHPCQST